MDQNIYITDVNPLSGSIPLTISITITTPSGGKWLTLIKSGSPFPNGGSGTSPMGVSAHVDPTGLSPGVYNAVIAIVPTGGATVTVSVTLTVTANPNATTLSLSATTLSFVCQSGTPGPPAQFVQLTETGRQLSFLTGSDAPTWLSVTPAAGDPPATLTVSVNPIVLSPGSYTGTITITLPLLAGASAKITVSLTVTAPAGPVIAGVANAASFGAGPVAAGEIVTLFGSGLGPANPIGLALDSSGKVATSLGGVSVSFNGYPAPLTYASATQINCVVPYEVDGATGVLVQVSYSGQYGALALKSAAVMPGIFSSNGSGTGTAAATNSTGGYNGPNNPAVVGSIVTLYLTGEGQTNPGGVTGKITTVDSSSGGPLTPQPVAGAPRVSIGGQPATVTFYGEAPGMVSGVLQLNVRIPAGLPGGSLQLVVSLGAASSQNGVTVSVQ